MKVLLRGFCLWCALAPAAMAGAETPADAHWAQATTGTDLPESALLAITLVPLAPGLESRRASEQQMALRNAEARYFPFLLRTVLAQTGQWGPVRMLPAPDPFAELSISGEIIDSSGDRLAIRLQAVDSTGRRWLDRQYHASAGPSDFEQRASADPFQPLFEEAAADLAGVRARLPLPELARIIETARLRHAAELAPEAFGDYLHSEADGSLRINRLPAAGDPMLARIERVRDTEYLFIDAVDQHFGQYFRNLGPTYTAWRKARLEADTLMRSYREQAASGRSGRRAGSAFQRYRELEELKLYQQTLRETLTSLAFEVGPTTLDLDGELVELSGTLEDQQRQWRALLGGIYAAQLGLPVGAGGAD